MVSANPTHRPWTVTLATLLSAVTIVANAALDALPTGVSVSWILLNLGFSLPAIAGTLGAYFGYNWGRALLLILTALAALLLPLLPSWEWSPIELVFWVPAVLTVVLLFLPASNSWFRYKALGS